MTWDPEGLVSDFLKVAEIAGVPLARDAITIERLPAPHVAPKHLPKGRMAVYVFSFGAVVLKVGKVGPKSAARYTTQHYTGAANSTLFASVLGNLDALGVSGLTQATCRAWIEKNTDRVNLLLDVNHGMPVLALLEAFMQCRLKPMFEGFASQRGG